MVIPTNSVPKTINLTRLTQGCNNFNKRQSMSAMGYNSIAVVMEYSVHLAIWVVFVIEVCARLQPIYLTISVLF